MKEVNDFDAMAQMVREDSKGMTASFGISDVKNGKKAGKVTIEVDRDVASKIMNGIMGVGDDVVAMLVVVDRKELAETRARLQEDS